MWRVSFSSTSCWCVRHSSSRPEERASSRSLVYSNNELSGSLLLISRKSRNGSVEWSIACDKLRIRGTVLLDTTGAIYVNERRFDSLFAAFGGILALVMNQVRLLFL